ncbi:FAD-dependent oxidoreductase [Mucilaginibacter sp. SMC90]|uniref:FAD-dependent oxidoreductase n=1 Tax=Mucilaginibacter sp. SMC90 TaxID=2929803 RepID=UPI001FB40D98|nr:FAD-dependent oxidoreductase [Mucilaginibacter sp. SMC90]UOE50956.1 FAD-dependent oxidoreductase [Mucilaginibacter sp. SMC90]
MAKHSTPISSRDGALKSPWQAGINPAHHTEKHAPGKVYDVVIIGAGITGLTAALLLQKAGKECLVVEAETPGFGTTGGTSAHINTFADTTYAEAQSAFGREGAKLFADAVNEGFALIKENINTYKIACDFEFKKGYVYAEDPEQVKQLDELCKGMLDVGLDCNYNEDIPVPVPHQAAVVMEKQAQFQPLKYLQGLEKAYLQAGGALLTHTRIESVKIENKIHLAKAGEQTFKAVKVIYATHVPPGITIFSFRCAPYRSYVLGVKLKDDNYPDALIYDLQEPYHYFRTHTIDNQKYLIVGGNDHKTGHDDPEKQFADLEKYVRKYYKVAEVGYKWSSQYYIPVDGFPYIGHIDGIYCATGFNGNGMMLGSISAKILADLILGKKSKYEKVFSPGRIKPVDGFSEFIKENADVAYHFVADRFGIHKSDSLKRLQPGTGKVVEIDGEKIAAYKDETGEIHALNPVCTHAGCIINWNGQEKSWDCPCHGARFDIDGKVLTGPATKDLLKINADEN